MKLEVEPRVTGVGADVLAWMRRVAQVVNPLDSDGAWANSSGLTVGAGTGSFGAASAQGWFRKVGLTVQFTLAVTITTNGTAAGYVTVTMPYATAHANIFPGREAGVSGVMCFASSSAGSPVLVIANYTSAYPGADGAVFVVSGVFEATV